MSVALAKIISIETRREIIPAVREGEPDFVVEILTPNFFLLRPSLRLLREKRMTEPICASREIVSEVLRIIQEESADFVVESSGSNFFLLRPLTRAANDWCAEHLPEDARRWGGTFVVEDSHILDVVWGAIDDGLFVR